MKPRRQMARIEAIAGVLFLGACGGGPSQVSNIVERDSAGVRIVENLSSAWRGTRGWSLGDEPRLRFEVPAADPENGRHGAPDAVRLSDGRIVVADVGANELRFYDATGRYLFTAGGPGTGPGEFRRLRSILRLPGDSVLAFDALRRRLFAFDRDGHLGRSAPLRSSGPESSTVPTLLDAFDDGSLLVRVIPAEGGHRTEGIRRTSLYRFLHHGPGGEVAEILGDFPGRGTFFDREAGFFAIMPVPFGQTTLGAAAMDQVFLCTNTKDEVRVYSPAGHLRAIYRGAEVPRPLQEEDVAAFVDQTIPTIEDPQLRQAAVARYRTLPLPETLPVYSDLRTDLEGNLWMRRFDTASSSDPSSWAVMDTKGVYLGDVRMPGEFSIREIGSDYVLGISVGTAGSDSVLLYELRKG